MMLNSQALKNSMNGITYYAANPYTADAESE